MFDEPIDGERFYAMTIQFPPQVGFVNKLSSIAEWVEKETQLPQWSSSAQKYDFFSSDNLRHVHIGHRSVSVVARSEEAWSTLKASGLSVMMHTVAGFGLTAVESLTLQCDSLLDLDMSFQEIASLGLDSMLSSPSALVDDPNDWALTLIRNEEHLETRVEVSPMTREMAVNHAKAVAQVTTIHDPVWGKNLNELLSNIDGDRLMVRVLITHRKPGKHDLERLSRRAEDEVRHHVSRSVMRIRNQV